MKLLKYILLLIPVFVCVEVFAQEKDSIKHVVVPDSPPEFPGGRDTLIKYLQDSIRYPNEALKKNISGKVIVAMIVNEDGSLSQVKIAHSPDTLLSNEALRLVNSMPNWIPGKLGDTTVKVYMRLPIVFRIKDRKIPEKRNPAKGAWIERRWHEGR